MVEKLKEYKVILASGSPRRQSLLTEMGVKFEVVLHNDIPEDFPETIPIVKVAEFLAEKKAGFYQSEIKDNSLVITADTVVILDNEILGKPIDANDACKMLRKLSGKSHSVITGVCIQSQVKKIIFSEETKVKFKQLTDSEIHHYVENYKPYDKAGSYGIQEWIGLVGIQGIEGCYFNVMGLPVSRIYDVLLSY